MKCNEGIVKAHTHLWIRPGRLIQEPTAWDMFLSLHMVVTGLDAQTRVDRSTGSIPASPDGKPPLTSEPFPFAHLHQMPSGRELALRYSDDTI